MKDSSVANEAVWNPSNIPRWRLVAWAKRDPEGVLDVLLRMHKRLGRLEAEMTRWAAGGAPPPGAELILAAHNLGIALDVPPHPEDGP